MTYLLVIAFFLTPALLLWLAHHVAWARRLGIIALCYIAGLLLGNTNLLPDAFASAQQGLVDSTVLLALPLLLFTLNVREWSTVAGKAMLSMGLATTSVVAIASCLFFLFRGGGAESAAHFAAMSVGVYTGGTPNLAAIKAGLDIPHGEYIVFHSLDTLIGAAYLLFMLTAGSVLFRRFLPCPSPGSVAAEGPAFSAMEPGADAGHYDSDDLSALLRVRNLPEQARVLALAALVVGVALGLAHLHARMMGVPRSPAVVIVVLTSLGIVLSLVPQVRRMQLAYKLGMYLIYVFCFAVASMASLQHIAEVDASIAAFIAVTVLGSVALHALLCRMARIDGDTFMVTSVAAVCSPPFVPMIARALGNPGAILSGMTAGIIGYALGNYLGISLGLYLQGL